MIRIACVPLRNSMDTSIRIVFAALRSMQSDFIFVSERCHAGGNLFAVGGGVQSICNYMETIVDMVQCFL